MSRKYRPRFPTVCSKDGCHEPSKYAVHLLLYSDEPGKGPIFVILPIVVCGEHKKEMTLDNIIDCPHKQAMIEEICAKEHQDPPDRDHVRVGFRRIHRYPKKKGPS